MYKYNKYKQKYLNLLYGGSDTYNIYVTNLASNLIYTLTLNNHETITIKDLKENIINVNNNLNDITFQLLHNTTILDDYHNITTNDKNDDNNIDLTITICNKSLYDILYNDKKEYLNQYDNNLFEYMKTLVSDIDEDGCIIDPLAKYLNRKLQIFMDDTYFIIYDCSIEIYYDDNNRIIIIIIFDKLNNLYKLNNIYNHQDSFGDFHESSYDYSDNHYELELNVFDRYYTNGILTKEKVKFKITISDLNDNMTNKQLKEILSFIKFELI